MTETPGALFSWVRCSVGVAVLNTASRCGQIFFGNLVRVVGRMCVCGCDHSRLQSWPIKPASLITFKSAVAQLNMAEEAADQPNFVQEETEILVQKVQALNGNLFITSLMKSNVLVTSLMLLKAETFQISLGVSYLQTSQVTFGLLSHSSRDRAHNSSRR